MITPNSFTAITKGVNAKKDGPREVIIEKGRVLSCPGCSKKNLKIIKNSKTNEFSIQPHKRPLFIGLQLNRSYCVYGGEKLELLDSLNTDVSDL